MTILALTGPSDFFVNLNFLLDVHDSLQNIFLLMMFSLFPLLLLPSPSCEISAQAATDRC